MNLMSAAGRRPAWQKLLADPIRRLALSFRVKSPSLPKSPANLRARLEQARSFGLISKTHINFQNLPLKMVRLNTVPNYLKLRQSETWKSADGFAFLILWKKPKKSW